MDTDQQRLALERERFEWEKRPRWAQRLAIFVPLAVAAISLAGILMVQRQESQRDQRAAGREFLLTAANIAMDSETPTGTLNRAKALEELFDERLPPDFVDGFNPEQYATPHNPGLAGVSPGVQLISMIAQNPSHCETILRTWRAVFPADEWVDRIECGA